MHVLGALRKSFSVNAVDFFNVKLRLLRLPASWASPVGSLKRKEER